MKLCKNGLQATVAQVYNLFITFFVSLFIFHFIAINKDTIDFPLFSSHFTSTSSVAQKWLLIQTVIWPFFNENHEISVSHFRSNVSLYTIIDALLETQDCHLTLHHFCRNFERTERAWNLVRITGRKYFDMNLTDNRFNKVFKM